ncbi:LAFE_0D00562g1_1 [Lachancea fermentati]|uniref:LAFE_0D00562g1_1 n=1 Tax=Lachancea fermentati TaxID=4955 RepID=A0A1G4MAM6_LACFM|nr:LAFE_0D00562g1_1 [Lachancea fermentati]
MADITKPNAVGAQFESLKVAIVGGTGGIGRSLSRLFASGGADVIEVGQTFRDADQKGIEFIKADLSSMSEAKRVADDLPAENLDIVIFTVGIFASYHKEETSEGLEKDMAASYLNRLVMIRRMAPRLGKERRKSSLKPRVFIYGYPGTNKLGNLDDLNSEKSYKVMTAHMNTVAGNEALVLDSASKYPNADFFGMNPGLIKTNIRSNLMGAGTLQFRLTEWIIGFFCQSVDDYAKKIVPIMSSSDLKASSGTMFNNYGKEIPSSPGLTQEYVSKFITQSEQLVEKWLQR